jgi:1-acyl-sn-glycerol-3-phosphate acyltransferase
VGLLPLLVVLSVLTDLVNGGRFPVTRMVLFLVYYLICESVGLALSAVLWAAYRLYPGVSVQKYHRWNFRLECFWARALMAGATGIFGFRIEVQGDHVARDGPLLLFIRHASVADTLLAAVLLSDRYDLQLRYVLKRELLWDPCMDVVGHRLPNVFIDRSAIHSQRETEAVRGIARDLGPRDGVLIYPEGTRFTPRKRERAIRKLAASGAPDLVERARAFRNVLPPRLGGPLALLDECTGIDVVFCAHVGFEGTTSFNDLWRGNLVGRCVRVCFWRVAGADIPKDRASRIDWLYDQWSRIDEWIASIGGSTASRTGPLPHEAPIETKQ